MIEIFSYLFFGGATTVVNIVVYFFFREVTHSHFFLANTMAWILSVLFAFITNKKWVFRTKSDSISEWLREAGLFVFYRGLSFVIDMVVMYCLLDWLGLSDFVSKITTQVLVVLLNYIFSKWLIFNKVEK